jgi:1-acyl-sn-glycerol-3-phosphate acyltransferase
MTDPATAALDAAANFTPRSVLELPPTRCNRRSLSYWVGRAVLKLMRFELRGTIPASQRWVLIAYPHTSNWDLPVMLAVALCYGLSPRWIGKHTLFRPPFGGLMRWLGGLPVDRRGANDTVAQVKEAFEAHRRAGKPFVLAVSPEGTRGPAGHIRSGFYHMAAAAQVPMIMGYLDWGRRISGAGPTVMPSGDKDADIEPFRIFAADIVGKYPAHTGPFVFKENDDTME